MSEASLSSVEAPPSCTESEPAPARGEVEVVGEGEVVREGEVVGEGEAVREGEAVAVGEGEAVCEGERDPLGELRASLGLPVRSGGTPINSNLDVTLRRVGIALLAAGTGFLLLWRVMTWLNA